VNQMSNTPIEVAPEMIEQAEAAFSEWKSENGDCLDLGGIGNVRDLLIKLIPIVWAFEKPSMDS